MTAPNGRYQVEQLVRGGWALTDAFEEYEAADDWAHTLLAARVGSVRVTDLERERVELDPVVWAVLSW